MDDDYDDCELDSGDDNGDEAWWDDDDGCNSSTDPARFYATVTVATASDREFSDRARFLGAELSWHPAVAVAS